MITDFIIQNILALIFFAGIAGAGSFLIGILKFRANNFFLYSGMAFFLSLCFYVILAIPFLKIFSNKTLVLEFYSGSYFLISIGLIFLFYKGLEWHKIAGFFKKNWAVLLATIFVLIVFFLQIYQTALFDEHLHRPVVKYFVANGELPFIDPRNSDRNITNSYHYGLYIPASAIQLLSGSAPWEALDVLKLSFAIASFFLIYGIVYQFSKKTAYSIFAGLVVLLGAGFFFFLDILSSGNFDIWDHSISFFRNPTLFLMAGITWINLILAVAFIWLIEKVFNKKALFDFGKILIFLILLGGFYLISELFVVLVAIMFIFSLVLNLAREKISVRKASFIILALMASSLLVIFSTGGVASRILGPEILDVLSYRSFGNWGYPNSQEIVSPTFFWNYFKSYALEMIILVFLASLFIVKRSRSRILGTFKKFPLIWLSIVICALVPFFFSTSFGDINFAKLTNLWVILLYLIFFYLFFNLKNNKTAKIILIILLILSCLPILIINTGIQWKENDRYERSRCRENNLCYPEEMVKTFEQFEKENPGLKKFLVASREEAAIVVDLSNATVEIGRGNLTKKWLEKNKIEYIFYTEEMRGAITEKDQQEIWKYIEAKAAGKTFGILGWK